MIATSWSGWTTAAAAHVVVTLVVGAVALLRPRRSPASRAAWLLLLVAAPFVGALAYFLVGETRIGLVRRQREKRARAAAAAPPRQGRGALDALPADLAGLFRVGCAIDGFPALPGNRIEVARDADGAIDAMVAAIEAAREHVHLCFYIWLADGAGTRMARAVAAAARRGLACRVLVDGLGSRALVESALWKEMAAAGVETRVALPIGHPLTRIFRGRADLRVHRKNVVIDHAVAFVGSRNCADPEFRVKAKFAPWVDIWLRVEGPVAQSCQRLFVEDWSVAGGADLSGLLQAQVAPREGGVVAQAVGSGPTDRGASMSDLFVAAMFAAREELVVTTPYYVPDDAIQAALCNAARRGARVALILPARCDSRFVAAASRSCYAELIEAGVALYEFGGGLLHAKTLTLDGRAALVGSANLDRRSLELNYENNLLFVGAKETAAVRAHQDDWRARSRLVTAQEVAAWSAPRRLRQNLAAVLGPLL